MTNGQSENDQLEAAHSPCKHSVILRNPQDPPFSIDPKSILAVFAVTTLEDRQYLKAAEGSLNNFNRFCQPRLWSAPHPGQIWRICLQRRAGRAAECQWDHSRFGENGHPATFLHRSEYVGDFFQQRPDKIENIGRICIQRRKTRILFPGNDGCIPI
jgi:hypothetical protein